MVRPYYDNQAACYKNCVALSNTIDGPLAKYIQRVRDTYAVSAFDRSSSSSLGCFLGLRGGKDYQSSCCDDRFPFREDSLLEVNDVPSLYVFLMENGYQINTEIAKMCFQSSVTFKHPILAFITYAAVP